MKTNPSITICISNRSLLLLVLLIGSITSANAAVTFFGLGHLPDRDQSYAADVSADGKTVVGRAYMTDEFWSSRAFIWTASEGINEIEVVTEPTIDRDSWATGVSADGSTVALTRGLWIGSGGSEPLKWSIHSGIIGEHLDIGLAYGISGNGSIVVGARVDWGVETEAWAWGGAGPLGDLSPAGWPKNSAAHAASHDGSVIVGVANRHEENDLAFRWTSATGMVSLGAASPSAANDVTADGSIIVGIGNDQAFRWTEALGVEYLGDLPGGALSSNAMGISANGEVIVGVGTDEGGSKAVVWTPQGGIQTLESILTGYGVDLTGWSLHSAVAVSADGKVIVGNGTNPAGNPEAFMARLYPPVNMTVTLEGSADLQMWEPVEAGNHDISEGPKFFRARIEPAE